ncbi:MAG: DNA-deoxyinosine glycosylase [Clostridia bacterium]|nr:DNA-deoxyinosine glycosylase [Clostridia bacterium]
MLRAEHPFPPVFDGHSRILILGSYPSVKSRQEGFFYGHPQNRFWRVLATVCGEAMPASVEAKQSMLLRHGLALWDVIAACEITGSSDASIRNAVPVDITRITKNAPIARVLCNGATAARLYARHLQPVTGLTALALPSTSPANASWRMDALTEAWRAALMLPPEGIR